MIKADTFDDKSSDRDGNTTTATVIGGVKPTKQKRGTANTVAKEEDDGKKTGDQRRRDAHPRASSSDDQHV